MLSIVELYKWYDYHDETKRQLLLANPTRVIVKYSLLGSNQRIEPMNLTFCLINQELTIRKRHGTARIIYPSCSKLAQRFVPS